ncbi:MAG TPA: sugar ABC transporter permease [Chloroflexota bacterium]|nr:sugar ABC transporter permease [Chloroflexota bacterium]
MASVRAIIPRRRRMTRLERREAIAFYLFASPWILGFLIWTLGPMLASLYLSFTNYDLFTPPQWVGLQNYTGLLTSDGEFRSAMFNTFYFVIIGLPVNLVLALATALLLNERLRGITFFRGLYYVPTLVPAVASGVLWISLFDPQYGVLDAILRVFHLPSIDWLADPNWIKPAIIITLLWGVGGGMIIYLAGLQNIPEQLYESAKIDGAGAWSRFFHVTLPLLTPTILFEVIIGLIGFFQIFDQIYVLTYNHPGEESITFMYYLFQTAFGSETNQMGYASAQAWIFFVIVMAATFLVFKTSARWVFYEGARQ